MKFIVFASILLSSLFLVQSRLKNFETCNKYTKKMTEEDKKMILELHNDYRNKVATKTTNSTHLPFAVNMIQMYWNDELALKAQEWANKCVKTQSDLAARANPKFMVGENIFSKETKGGTPRPEWKLTIGTWFNQMKGFISKPVKKFKFGGRQTEAFSQLIWAQSYWLGCGFSLSNTNRGMLSVYVCQYGPGGNVANQPIYIESTKKECKCLQGLGCKNPKYPGLCCPDGFCKDDLYYTGEPFPGTVIKMKK